MAEKKEAVYYVFRVDGKILGYLPEKMAKKELKRLEHLYGVEIEPVDPSIKRDEEKARQSKGD